MVVDIKLNLCEKVVKEMQKVGIKPENIARIQNNEFFKEAYDKPNSVQKAFLTHILHSILVDGPEIVPGSIRLALDTEQESLVWLEKVILTIIPFLKENEDKFFPTT